jgi:hypothetical protein
MSSPCQRPGVVRSLPAVDRGLRLITPAGADGASATLHRIATRSQLHREVDSLSDEQIERAHIGVEEEIEHIEVSEACRTIADGTPQPDWTAIIRSQRDHAH